MAECPSCSLIVKVIYDPVSSAVGEVASWYDIRNIFLQEDFVPHSKKSTVQCEKSLSS